MGYQINKLTAAATTMVRQTEGKIKGLDKSKNPVGDIKEVLLCYHSALSGLIVEMVEIENILQNMTEEKVRTQEINVINDKIKGINGILRMR